VALSTVDVAGARGNLAEADGRSFERVRSDATAAWQRLLGRVQIDADARTSRIFFSAMYRTLLHPSDIADADGRVRGPRGGLLLAPGRRYDSTLSLWDTFRAVHPLHTLLVPERVAGNVGSLLAHHRQMGWLPLWTAWGRETYTMIGNPALPVLADAVAKGFDGFNARDVLAAMVETSTRDRPDAPPWAQRLWTLYERFGWLPFDLHEAGESVSKTLEYGIGDDAVARVARLLGEIELAERFARRAAGWRQLWDAGTQTLRGKDSTGRWREPFDPLAATSPMNNPGDYTEANAWQYTATPALHDAAGFRDLLGGPAALEAWLDRFFATPMPNPDKHLGQEAMIGQLAHGNEPSHHIPWLYAFTPNPTKGHAMVERIAREFYGDKPDGIVGNDDCGQMGAWFVFAALGLYPVQPASGHYVAGRPLVREANLTLQGGRRLRIVKSGRRGGGLRFNGQALDPTAVPHRLLVQGGVLEFGVGDAPAATHTHRG
jgi:predicted alpha-1,2-mannosidase